ncbi:unnamed protein product [Brassica rapa subsp. trilocularis]|uniref:(rape) hypothetical protein n=1 Tax=Brassica napus TaxID=3708 RepID=A0A816STC7_BRANA|nr:unnamed protein product [Brassica napus]
MAHFWEQQCSTAPRSVLPDEKTLKSFVEKMVLEESNRKDNQGRADLINTLIIKKGK